MCEGEKKSAAEKNEKETRRKAATEPEKSILNQEALKPGEDALAEKALADPQAEKPPCKITEAALRDKLRGMILYSAYADALGAPQEVKALSRGEVVDPAKLGDLRKLGDYNRAGEGDPKPFGMWVDTTLPAHKAAVGLPTDDTSIRVALIYPWLGEVAKGRFTLTEGGFYKYLRQVKPDNAVWSATRLEAAKAIIATLEDAVRYAGLSPQQRSGFTPNPKNKFWKPSANIIFGIFFYLELAALAMNCDRAKVFRDGERRTRLEKDEGRFTTGLLSVIISRAVCKTDPKAKFGDFFFAEKQEVVKRKLGKTRERARLSPEIDAARAFGEMQKADSELDFVKALSQRLFGKNGPQANFFSTGAEPYQPATFLKAFAAALGYAGGDHAKAIRILAASAGDADTMPALLASIIGAFFGEAALGADQKIKNGMAAAEAALAAKGGVDINALVAGLVALARKQGCCEVTK